MRLPVLRWRANNKVIGENDRTTDFALFSCAANGPTDPKEEPIGIVGIERRGSIASAKSVFSKSLVL